MSGLDIQLVDAVSRYVERKSVGDPDGPGAGTYASNAESVLRRWATSLADERDVHTLGDLQDAHLQWYAADLADRVDDGAYTASTASTYFAVVRAFLSWCVAEGALESNPATTEAVVGELPAEDADRASGRGWSPDAREALESYVRDRAADPDDDRLARLRDHALVAVVVHTGLRGAELFRVPEDDRRSGATWDDVDFHAGTIRVLGKSQRLEDVGVPAPARKPLRRYRVALDPPTNEWPVFPTRHAPSIARRVRTELRAREFDADEVDDLLAGTTAIEVARERSIPPPAITTEGARSVLRRLCEAADVDVDGEYLTPRSAREDPDATDRARTDATASSAALEYDTRERSLVAVEDEPGSRDGADEQSSSGNE